MVLLYADGFDEGMQDWASNTGMVTFTGTNARSGYCAIYQQAGNFRRVITPSATVIVGCALRWDARETYPSGLSAPIITFFSDNNTTQHCGLYGTNDGSLRLANCGGPTLLTGGTTATNVIATNSTYYYIELKVTISDTIGAMALRVNNSLLLNLTNVDTKNGGTSSLIDAVSWHLSGVSGNILTDDVYILDGTGSYNNDFLGDLSVEHLRPTGDDAVTWTRSTGSTNFSCVDEMGNADTSDYNGSPTVGNRDFYTIGPSARVAGTVHGVYVSGTMAKSDAGARNAALCIREGAAGAIRTATSQTLSTSYVAYRQAYDRKNDGSAWSISDINALRIGAEVTA
jgi:hypothetical protein